jgi:hypothetical protein
MNKTLDKAEDIEKIAEMAHRGEDVSDHFTGRYQAKQRLNIDVPLHLLRIIDEECKRAGLTREAWIKMACDEKLRGVRTNQNTSKVS